MSDGREENRSVLKRAQTAYLSAGGAALYRAWRVGDEIDPLAEAIRWIVDETAMDYDSGKEKYAACGRALVERAQDMLRVASALLGEAE